MGDSNQLVTVELPGETAAVLRRLGNVEAILRVTARELDKQNQITIGHIQEHKLSERGPTTLGVVTNRLRSSPRATPAILADGGLRSSIGTNVLYAGVHEFGFEGEVNVRAHVRRIGQRFQIDNGRRSVTRSVAARLGLLTKKGKPRKGMATPVHQDHTGTMDVKAHMRKMKVPARRMFRTGIQERLPAVGKALAGAVAKAVAKGN